MIKKKIIIAILLFKSTSIMGSTESIIEKIIFNGLNRISEKTALLNTSVKIGDKINKKNIQNTIIKLFSTKQFEKIKITQKKNNLIIYVKEKPIIKNITFIGNRSITKENLKKYLKYFSIESGKTFDKKQLFLLTKEIKKYFYDIGKFCIKIDNKIKTLPNNKVNLSLIFSEGTRAKIHQINIIGNNIFSLKSITKNINNNNLFTKLINDSSYTKEKFINKLNNIQNFYLNKGFIKFSINSTNLSLTPDKKNIYVHINITEGERYKIKEIKINKMPKKINEKIKKIIKIKKNEFYNNKKIQNIKNKIDKMLKNKGYLYSNINNKIYVNDYDKNVVIHININTGKKFYVRYIQLIGNKMTNDEVLRSEINQIEGTIFNYNLVKSSINKLYKTGFFEKVTFDIIKAKNTTNQIDIIYKVKEKSTGSINFGIGIGNQNGINFQASAKEDNILGTGKSIKIIVNKNNFSKYAELNIINPYFTKKNLKLNKKIFFNNSNAKYANLSDYKNKSYGMDNKVNMKINKNNEITLGTNFTKNKIFNIKPQINIWRYIKSIKKNAQLNKENNIDNMDYIANLEWTFNNLNHHIFPTKGTKSSINTQITIPGSDNNYFKIKFNISKYFSIDKKNKWIIHLRSQIGYANGMNKKDFPFYENFYLGGINNIRGFQTNNIGPKAIYLKQYDNEELIPNTNNLSNDPIGGNSTIFTSLELAIPNPFTKNYHKNSTRTSLFIDAGNVWDSNWNKIPKSWLKNIPDYGNPNNIRISTGISLKWISPFGPLIFSYAKPIKSFIGDENEEFQFNFGKIW